MAEIWNQVVEDGVAFPQEEGLTGKGKYETDLMECERAESLHAEGIPGFLSGNGCRYFLLAGDKIAGGTDRTGSARISSVLEFCR